MKPLDTSRLRSPLWAAVFACAAGLALFHLWGNATQGYVKTPSLFVWWARQWFITGAELEHGPLVLAGAGFLCWLGWRRQKRQKGTGRFEERGPGQFQAQTSAAPEATEPLSKEAGEVADSWRPLLALFMALALHAFGLWWQQPRVSAVAWCVYLGGCATLAWGRDASRWFRPGRWFLLLSLPFGFVEAFGLSFQLRLAVATLARHVCGVFGFSVVQSGTALLPASGGQAFEVAAACSGLRSLTALTALAVFLAIWKNTGWKRGSAVVLIAWAAVAAGNLARVCGTVFAGGALHETWGVGVFILESALVAWLATRWARETPASPTGQVSQPLRRVPFCVTLSLTALVVAAGLIYTRILAQHPETATALKRQGNFDLSPLPDILLGDWLGREAPLTSVEREVLPPDTLVVRTVYERLGRKQEAALATVVLAGVDRSSLHRPELCLNGTGWGIGARQRIPVAPEVEGTLLTLRRGEEKALMLYWFAAPGRTRAGFGEMIIDGLLARTRGARERWSSFAVQVWIRPDETEAQAQARATAVAAALWDAERA